MSEIKGFIHNRKKYGYKPFSAALIPLVFMLTAFSSSFSLSSVDFYSEVPGEYESSSTIDPRSLDNPPVDSSLIFAELDQKGITGDSPVTGSLSKTLYSQPGGIIQVQNARNENMVDNSGSPGSNSRASGIDISVSNFFTYDSIIDELPPWYSAGEVGKTTHFSFFLENLGSDPSSNVEVTFRIFDYFNNEADNQSKVVSLTASENLSVDFDWIPQYSNYYNVSLRIDATGDTNLSNNEQFWKYIIAVRWSENFETGTLSDWEGDKGDTTQWHITDSINNDPNPGAHSTPRALYHGDETSSDDYGISEDFYITLPTFDLRRFNSDWPGTFLLYQFYGSSSPDDELILEIKASPDNDFEYSSILPRLSGDTKHQVTDQWEWQAWHSDNSKFFGIPISIFTGEVVSFRLHWQSDTVPEDKTGFYLDDFLLFGLESPKPKKDVGLDNLVLDFEHNAWDMIVAGDTIEISADVKNYGRLAQSDISVQLSIIDEHLREVTNIVEPIKTIHTLNADAQVPLKWEFTPEICGNFYISVQNLLPEDETQFNDYINTTITVAKYYNDFESDDDNWTTDGIWRRIEIPNDPDSMGHSRTTGWYIGDDNYSYDTNLNAVLISPKIDLQGVNPKNPDIKIFTNYKFYGNTAETDILYFEYALDGKDEWKLVNDGGSLGQNYTTQISGIYVVKWYDQDEIKQVQIGSTDFIGHTVQFRWRFVSDHIDEGLPGFFIDDFIIWSIEEDYRRPMVKSPEISQPVLEDHYGDSVRITALIEDKDNNIIPGGVTVDLSALGLSASAALYDDGTNGDTTPGDNIYSLNLTGAPELISGDHILVIKAVDAEGKIGRGFIDLKLISNTAPELVDITPFERSLEIDETDTIQFSVEAQDIGDKLNFKWFLDDVLLQEGSEKTEFDFLSSFEGNYSAGIYSLNVTVFDDAVPALNSSFEWEITVADILPDLAVNSSDLDLSDPDPAIGDIIYFNLTVFNKGEKPEQNVKFNVYRSAGTDIGTNLSNLELFGEHNIDFIDLINPYTGTFPWKVESGHYTFLFIVDPYDVITESDEINNIVTVSIDIPVPEPKQIDKTLPEILYANPFFMTAIITIVLISAGFGAAVGGTEIGRYRFFALMVPLYSRLKGTKILSHSLREEIYNHIKKYPGDHYRSIMNKLNLKNGTLVHHLSRLEQEELIKSQKDGLYKRFYPIGMKIPQSDVGMYYPDGTITYNISDKQVSEIQMNILKAINNKPGCTQKDISEIINESRRVVNYHIKLLTQSKLIKVVRQGRETQCFLRVDLT